MKFPKKEDYPDIEAWLKACSDMAVEALETDSTLTKLEEANRNSPESLRKLAFLYLRTPDVPFKVGQIVRWKDNAMAAKNFKTNMVIVEVFEPIDTEVIGKSDSHNGKSSEPCSPMFGEKLDTRIGFVDKDGDFMMFHVDSRRLAQVEA